MDPKTIQVMIDLETMGVESNSVICSIGAVKFDITKSSFKDSVLDEFYCTVDALDCKRHGLVFTQTTLDWWAKQDPQTLKLLRKDNVSLMEALERFSKWYGGKSLPTWGNGAAFDNVILENAYKAVGLTRPWLPWDDRCYRTIKNLLSTKPPARGGTYHNALDDSRFQTQHLLMMLKS
jgi:hypothetical protein